MSLSKNIRSIGFRLGVATTTDVPKQLGVNLVTASAAPSINVPSARVERPPSPPALRITPAVPGDRTGRISSVLPTRYSPTAIPFISLGDSDKLKIAGEKLRTKFFSGTTKGSIK